MTSTRRDYIPFPVAPPAAAPLPHPQPPTVITLTPTEPSISLGSAAGVSREFSLFPENSGTPVLFTVTPAVPLAPPDDDNNFTTLSSSSAAKSRCHSAHLICRSSCSLRRTPAYISREALFLSLPASPQLRALCLPCSTATTTKLSPPADQQRLLVLHPRILSLVREPSCPRACIPHVHASLALVLEAILAASHFVCPDPLFCC